MLLAAWSAVLCTLAASSAAAETYPNRPVRLVVSLSAGGVMDGLARLLGERLEAALGQPVIIDNRPGASGNIASQLVARAPPDGYTLLVAFTALTVLPTTYGARAVDPVQAFAPVTKLVTQPILIAVIPTLGAHSLGALVALAKRNPGTLAYATGGVASADHLAAAILSTRAGIEMVHVPYNSVGHEIKDLLAGEVRVAFMLLGTAQPYLRTGQLKALAVTGSRRVAAIPDVPTVAESGLPGFEVVSWFGILAPAGTPVEIVDRLQREITRILQLPDVQESLAAKGLEPVGSSPGQFADEIRTLVRFWPPVVKAAGIPLE